MRRPWRLRCCNAALEACILDDRHQLEAVEPGIGLDGRALCVERHALTGLFIGRDPQIGYGSHAIPRLLMVHRKYGVTYRVASVVCHETLGT